EEALVRGNQGDLDTGRVVLRERSERARDAASAAVRRAGATARRHRRDGDPGPESGEGHARIGGGEGAAIPDGNGVGERPPGHDRIGGLFRLSASATVVSLALCVSSLTARMTRNVPT